MIDLAAAEAKIGRYRAIKAELKEYPNHYNAVCAELIALNEEMREGYIEAIKEIRRLRDALVEERVKRKEICATAHNDLLVECFGDIDLDDELDYLAEARRELAAEGLVPGDEN
jgi:hypothetical protein